MRTKYKERQYFEGKAVYALLGLGFISALYGLGRSLYLGEADIRTSTIYILIMAASAGLIWWFRRLRMKVSINAKRIKYKLSPLHREARRITWDEVASCELVKTPWVAQWHGSNLHYANEAMYSLAGRNGLSIETKDGQRLFIGCKNVDELAATLDELPVGE